MSYKRDQAANENRRKIAEDIFSGMDVISSECTCDCDCACHTSSSQSETGKMDDSSATTTTTTTIAHPSTSTSTATTTTVGGGGGGLGGAYGGVSLGGIEVPSSQPLSASDMKECWSAADPPSDSDPMLMNKSIGKHGSQDDHLNNTPEHSLHGSAVDEGYEQPESPPTGNPHLKVFIHPLA